jgi:hypothetical protein
VLPPQKNLERATELAFEALRGQPDEQLRWLGAEPVGGVWNLPVLNDRFVVDQASQRVTVQRNGGEASPQWRILALHYLATASRPDRRPPEVTFADLPTARSYAGIYRQRTTARLCATIGRELEGLQAAAAALGARVACGGDAAFDFDVFPRLSLRLIWHAPDEEFPASATLLMPDNIESFFCSEDVVVLSERLVSRLCGRPF